jgi:hypothetical protein
MNMLACVILTKLIVDSSWTREFCLHRHELPTDDHQYEIEKERKKEQEEERRGAANAVSHNEFLYI